MSTSPTLLELHLIVTVSCEAGSVMVLIFQMREQSTERLSNLPKVTQLISSTARVQAQGSTPCPYS